ncbi:MAG: M81 family metallopeptidase [Candidatus Bathyarchaeota archaeon]|nr:M81 family metallopeptidase [Candidatus Bathyarchaeota archaeon]
MVGYRVIIGSMSHETNTFSTVKTTMSDFRPKYGEEIVATLRGTRSGIGGYIEVFEREEVEYIPTIAAGATPAGPLRNADYWKIVEYIKNEIKQAGKIDGVLLALHGAMVAENVPEAEGTLLREVKKLVGETPIIITLDLHGLISDMIVENCDAIFGYDTNPHVDMYERGVEAAEALMKTIRGKIKPTVAHKKLRMLPPTINQRTAEGPMVKLLETARRMEEQTGVLNVCLFPAFPYADVKRVGSAVVAVTDNDPKLAQKLADELGAQMWNLREEFLKPLTPIDEAVKTAMDAPEGPIVLADVADNPGGGAPGDGTEILRELLKKGAKNVGIACIKDPEAVQRAIEAGVKGTITMKIGAKTDDFHGEPLEVTGVVRTITDGRFIHKAMAIGVPADVGRTAVIDVNGIEIILTERSHAPNDPEVYRRNGIEPTDKKILVLKSRGHFRAAYEPFSKMVLEVDAPGLTTPNLEWFTYQNIPRPIWPFDQPD